MLFSSSSWLTWYFLFTYVTFDIGKNNELGVNIVPVRVGRPVVEPILLGQKVYSNFFFGLLVNLSNIPTVFISNRHPLIYFYFANVIVLTKGIKVIKCKTKCNELQGLVVVSVSILVPYVRYIFKSLSTKMKLTPQLMQHYSWIGSIAMPTP